MTKKRILFDIKTVFNKKKKNLIFKELSLVKFLTQISFLKLRIINETFQVH